MPGVVLSTCFKEVEKQREASEGNRKKVSKK